MRTDLFKRTRGKKKNLLINENSSFARFEIILLIERNIIRIRENEEKSFDNVDLR